MSALVIAVGLWSHFMFFVDIYVNGTGPTDDDLVRAMRFAAVFGMIWSWTSLIMWAVQ